MATILLFNSEWLIEDSERVRQNGAVYIEDNTITEVGETKELENRYRSTADESIDCSGTIVMPGLINAHNHVYEITERGLGKDYTMEDWLRYVIYPINKMLDSEDYYYAGLLACANAFQTGTTSLVDQLTNFARFHADDDLRAFKEAGIRGAVARAVSTQSSIDPDENRPHEKELHDSEEYLKRWEQETLVEAWLGPAGLYSCDHDILLETKKMSKKHGTRYHIHLSETFAQADSARKSGYTGQVDCAHKIGLLDEQTSIAHAVWINEGEMKLIKEHGSQVIHNPTSNQILSSGVANVPKWLELGLDVALATDGPASNDSMDMVTEMKSCVLMHRLNTLNPQVMKAKDAFKMATVGGAKILGREDTLGRIAKGCLADVTRVNIKNNPSINPIYDPIDALVYYGSGRDVDLTIVNGVIVYRNGEYPTLNMTEIMKSMEKIRIKVNKELTDL
jgi:5-methylthioadenosine/S-adenosylhomocysteine deaminase